MKRFASIDLGSNTVRLLIAEETADGDFRELHSERRIIRLGEGIHADKRLQPHRMELAIQTLNEFQKICKTFGEVSMYAAATSAVREAKNKDDFVKNVREQTGLILHVIPWEDEAALTLEGVLWKLPLLDKTCVTFDIGGGSTEFIFSKGRDILATAGTSLGVVRLTERFITRHPVDANEFSELDAFLKQEFDAIKEKLGAPQPQVLVGTAGTVTTLAALEADMFPYDPLKIHGTQLARSRVEHWLADLKSKSLEERIALKPLEQGREDLIIAGTALTLWAMQSFSSENLTISEYSLREGLLLRARQQLA